MTILQLEFNLWEQLKQAEADPTAIAFQQLCLCFDAELERMSPKDKLEQGAEAIARLADLLAIRAESYFEEWQQRFDPTGPSLEDDFSDLVRQSFSLEFEDLIGEAEPSYRLPNQTEPFKSSLVSEMSKEDLLELLEDSAVKQNPLEIERLQYDEDISAWIAIVRSWLDVIGGGQAELMQVIQGTAMSPIKVWMALLLGGFRLEKQGDFYAGDVIIEANFSVL